MSPEIALNRFIALAAFAAFASGLLLGAAFAVMVLG
jgi:hypothetical protein